MRDRTLSSWPRLSRPACPAPRPRARTGFSILEVLIAIAIILALTGIVWPASRAWIDSARFEETSRQLPAALAAVRAEARRDGVARLVSARRTDEGVRIVAARLAPAGDEEDPPADPTPTQVVFELPAGYGLRDDSASLGDAGLPASQGALVSPSLAPGFPDTLAVVTYAPDGSAWPAAPVALAAPRGRTASLRFDRWTGRARIETSALPAPPSASSVTAPASSAASIEKTR